MQPASNSSIVRPQSGTPFRRPTVANERTKWIGLAIWAVGSLWLPVGCLFGREFHWLLYNSGLHGFLKVALAPIPAWCIIVSGPILALTVLRFMPISARVRKRLAILPIVVLFSTAAIWIFSILVFSGWPTD